MSSFGGKVKGENVEVGFRIVQFDGDRQLQANVNHLDAIPARRNAMISAPSQV